MSEITHTLISNTNVKDLDIMSIKIDNTWQSKEFAKLFDSITWLYELHFVFYDTSAPWDRGLYSFPPIVETTLNFYRKRILSIADPSSIIENLYESGFLDYHPLEVRKLKFGSKGFVDFLGIGTIFSSIKEIIFNYIPNKSTFLDHKLKEIEVEKKRLELLNKRMKFLESLGLNQMDALRIIGKESEHVNRIVDLIERNKIYDIKLGETSKDNDTE